MINLFVSYYQDENTERQWELDECLKRNIENELIDHIYVFIEYPIDNEILKHKKIHTILIHKRPTYELVFAFINMLAKENDINIVANSDIYFDETLQFLNDKLGLNDCFALCRYEVQPGGTTFLNRPDAQDCWIFKGNIKLSVRADFGMGKCGCDNAIAYRLQTAGYNVTNPSLTIKSYHLHNSGIRNYKIEDKVPQPYKVIHPTV